jgi:hypothetical protein
MSSAVRLVTTFVVLFGAGTWAPGATHFVDVHSVASVAPYTNWASAARTIQDAIDSAAIGEQVIVTNGLYEAGGQSTLGRVALTKAITVSSLNGAQYTSISGSGMMRCAYLVEGASLSGFTLTNGLADRGAGAYCEPGFAALMNCTLTGNSAASDGGGAYYGTLVNCVLLGNSAVQGGGASASTLANSIIARNWASDSGGGLNDCICYSCSVTGNVATNTAGGTLGGILGNCTIVGNSAKQGGGGYAAFGGSAPCQLNNSIIYYNQAIIGTNCPDGTQYNCCTPQAEFGSGLGNISGPPLFVDLNSGNLRLLSNSPCIDAGNNANVSTHTDLDGNPRVLRGIVDIGAYEYAGALDPVHFPPGKVTHYVARTGAAIPPYTNWTSAAKTVQAAVDAAGPGDEIVVTNGIYAMGGRAVYGQITNRVAVDKPILLRSVNGPKVTVIEGYQIPGTTNGDGAIRCVYLTNNATLVGFTLTNGATRMGSSADIVHEQSGGGIYCEPSALVSDCILAGNSAVNGGGVFCGRVYNSRFYNNSAVQGGAAFADVRVNGYEIGGGGLLNGCLIGSNTASAGGGVFGGELNNCTLVGNRAERGGAVYAYSWSHVSTLCTVNNCILFYNTADNWYAGSESIGPSTFFNHCCTTPLPPTDLDAGSSTVTNSPLFVDPAAGDFRLQASSLCVDAGVTAYAPTTVDLNGNARIVGGTVDIGAYEFQGSTAITFQAWLQSYGLPSDGSADYVDTDGDGMNNWQEWVCGTDPTNPLLVLRMLQPVVTSNNVTVTWQSVSGVSYFLERSLNLGSSNVFSLVATNIPGQAGTNFPGQGGLTTFVDTNVSSGAQLLYRVGVKH